jgi:hypothetical protein
VTFQYPEVIHNHFKYRHYIDDHNNKRQSPISLEETWATKKWEFRVFAFLLAVTEVNVMLASTYFYNREETSFLEFRKDFAKSMIHNDHLNKVSSNTRSSDRKRTATKDHALIRLPKKMKFSGTALVSANMDYCQWKCSGCKNKVRTYCQCTPGIIRCAECYATHKADS